MSILYIPWRKNYKRKLPTEACPFCVAFLAHNDRENLVIKRFKTCALVLCLHPYNAGHLLIIPYKHTGIFADLSPEERHEIERKIKLRRRYEKQLRKVNENLHKIRRMIRG